MFEKFFSRRKERSSPVLSIGSLDWSAFTEKERSKFHHSLYDSVFFTSAMEEKMNMIASSWDPYFVNASGEETEHEVGMTILNAPYGVYTKDDLIAQFTKQRTLYGVALIDLTAGIDSFDQNILDGSSIEKLIVNGGIITTAKILDKQGSSKAISIGVEGIGEGTAVVSLKQNVLEGWSNSEIYPLRAENKLKPLVEAEIALTNAILSSAVNTYSPNNAFIFDPDVSKQDIQDYENMLRDKAGEPQSQIMLKKVTIQPLTQHVKAQDLIDNLKEVRKNIMLAIGIPADVFQISTSSSSILYQAVLSNLHKTVVEPEISSYTELWNTQINDMTEINKGIEGDVELRYKPTQPETIAETVRRLRELVDGNILIPNEARSELAYEELPDGNTLIEDDPNIV